MRISACAAAVALALLAWYGGEVDRARPTLARALAAPAAHSGAELAVFREARVVEVRAGGDVVVCERAYGPAARAVVRGVSPPVEPGNAVSLRARFLPPDRLDALEHRVNRTRFVKVWVSLPVLAWIAGLAAVRLRLTRQGIEER